MEGEGVGVGERGMVEERGGWWRRGEMVEEGRDGGRGEGWWRRGGMVEEGRDGGGGEGWWRNRISTTQIIYFRSEAMME